MVARPYIKLNHLLWCLVAALAAAIAVPLVFTINLSIRNYLRADQDLAGVRSYEILLSAANHLSAERGPANVVMSIEPGSSAEALERLRLFRKRTDESLAAALQQAEISRLGQQVAAPLLDATTRLRSARLLVDRASATPRAERSRAGVAHAIAAMIEAVDLMQPAIAADARQLAGADSSISGLVLVARAVSDMREYGGRIASYITPAVSQSKPLSQSELDLFNRTLGHLLELRLQLNAQPYFQPGGPLGTAAEETETVYFGKGLPLVMRLAVEGQSSGQYSVAPEALTPLYVPTLKPLEDLRRLYINAMLETVSQQKSEALLHLIFAIPGAFTILLLVALLLYFTRRLVLRPLLRAHAAILSLAEGRTAAPEAQQNVIDEVQSLFDAMQVLGRHLTDRNRLMVDLRVQAETDRLTGLPNRTAFENFVSGMLPQAKPGQMAVMYIDLDDFKTINDTLGHHVGDQLLVGVALRLRECVGRNAFVARLGGDEFATCCTDIDPIAQATLACDILQAMTQPFDLLSHQRLIGASIGIASMPQAGASYTELCQQADIALYQAKAAGRNTFRTFSGEMLSEVLERSTLQQQLSSALETRQFEVWFQPIVQASTGALAGHEALLRWRHPEKGIVLPGEFIPLLECSGLIHDVGRWALKEATRLAASWPDDIHLSVNVSALQLQHPQFGQEVAEALALSSFPARRLCLEITESSLLGDSPVTLRSLAVLHTLGVQIAIDDFGTGYSSLGYLRQRSFNLLKLDRSFTAGIGTASDSATIIHSVIELAHGLGISTIAEGVETEEQLAWLREQGCDYIQGYLIGYPVSPQDMHSASTLADTQRLS